jgi:hypothetical protein
MQVFAKTGPATRTGAIAAKSKRFKPMGFFLSSSKGSESATANDPFSAYRGSPARRKPKRLIRQRAA